MLKCTYDIGLPDDDSDFEDQVFDTNPSNDTLETSRNIFNIFKSFEGKVLQSESQIICTCPSPDCPLEKKLDLQLVKTAYPLKNEQEFGDKKPTESVTSFSSNEAFTIDLTNQVWPKAKSVEENNGILINNARINPSFYKPLLLTDTIKSDIYKGLSDSINPLDPRLHSNRKLSENTPSKDKIDVSKLSDQRKQFMETVELIKSCTINKNLIPAGILENLYSLVKINREQRNTKISPAISAIKGNEHTNVIATNKSNSLLILKESCENHKSSAGTADLTNTQVSNRTQPDNDKSAGHYSANINSPTYNPATNPDTNSSDKANHCITLDDHTVHVEKRLNDSSKLSVQDYGTTHGVLPRSALDSEGRINIGEPNAVTAETSPSDTVTTVLDSKVINFVRKNIKVQSDEINENKKAETSADGEHLDVNSNLNINVNSEDSVFKSKKETVNTSVCSSSVRYNKEGNSVTCDIESRKRPIVCDDTVVVKAKKIKLATPYTPADENNRGMCSVCFLTRLFEKTDKTEKKSNSCSQCQTRTRLLCPTCNKSFSNLLVLYAHLLNHNQEKEKIGELCCSLCKMKSDSELHFYKHMAFSICSTVCIICESIFKSHKLKADHNCKEQKLKKMFKIASSTSAILVQCQVCKKVKTCAGDRRHKQKYFCEKCLKNYEKNKDVKSCVNSALVNPMQDSIEKEPRDSVKVTKHFQTKVISQKMNTSYPNEIQVESSQTLTAHSTKTKTTLTMQSQMVNGPQFEAFDAGKVKKNNTDSIKSSAKNNPLTLIKTNNTESGKSRVSIPKYTSIQTLTPLNEPNLAVTNETPTHKNNASSLSNVILSDKSESTLTKAIASDKSETPTQKTHMTPIITIQLLDLQDKYTNTSNSSNENTGNSSLSKPSLSDKSESSLTKVAHQDQSKTMLRKSSLTTITTSEKCKAPLNHGPLLDNTSTCQSHCKKVMPSGEAKWDIFTKMTLLDENKSIASVVLPENRKSTSTQETPTDTSNTSKESLTNVTSDKRKSSFTTPTPSDDTNGSKLMSLIKKAFTDTSTPSLANITLADKRKSPLIKCTSLDDSKLSTPTKASPTNKRRESLMIMTLSGESKSLSLTKVTPIDQSKSALTQVSANNESKSSVSKVTPADQSKASFSKVIPADQSKSSVSKVTPANQSKSSLANVSAFNERKSSVTKVTPTESHSALTKVSAIDKSESSVSSATKVSANNEGKSSVKNPAVTCTSKSSASKVSGSNNGKSSVRKISATDESTGQLSVAKVTAANERKSSITKLTRTDVSKSAPTRVLGSNNGKSYDTNISAIGENNSSLAKETSYKSKLAVTNATATDKRKSSVTKVTVTGDSNSPFTKMNASTSKSSVIKLTATNESKSSATNVLGTNKSKSSVSKVTTTDKNKSPDIKATKTDEKSSIIKVTAYNESKLPCTKENETDKNESLTKVNATDDSKSSVTKVNTINESKLSVTDVNETGKNKLSVTKAKIFNGSKPSVTKVNANDKDKSSVTNVNATNGSKSSVTKMDETDNKSSVTKINAISESKLSGTGVNGTDKNKSSVTRVNATNESKASVTKVNVTYKNKSAVTMVTETDKNKSAVTMVTETDKNKSAVTMVTETDKNKSAGSNVNETNKNNSSVTRLTATESKSALKKSATDECKTTVTKVIDSSIGKSSVTKVSSTDESKSSAIKVSAIDESKSSLSITDEINLPSLREVIPSGVSKSPLIKEIPSGVSGSPLVSKSPLIKEIPLVVSRSPLIKEILSGVSKSPFTKMATLNTVQSKLSSDLVDFLSNSFQNVCKDSPSTTLPFLRFPKEDAKTNDSKTDNSKGQTADSKDTSLSQAGLTPLNNVKNATCSKNFVVIESSVSSDENLKKTVKESDSPSIKPANSPSVPLHSPAQHLINCRKCSYSTDTHYNLDTHLHKVHHMKKKYYCRDKPCNRSFVLEKCLDKHHIDHNPSTKQFKSDSSTHKTISERDGILARSKTSSGTHWQTYRPNCTSSQRSCFPMERKRYLDDRDKTEFMTPYKSSKLCYTRPTVVNIDGVYPFMESDWERSYPYPF